MPRVKDFAISNVDFLVASDKSNLSGIDLGCIDFTGAFHTFTVREHEDGRLALQIDCVWYTYRVIPLGLASSFDSSLTCGSVNVPVRGGQSPNICGRPCDRLCANVSCRSCSCSSGQPWARTCPRGQVRPKYQLDRHHDHCPPTPRLQSSVDRSPSAQSRRTPAPCGKTHSENDSWTSKKFYMSLEFSAGAVTSRGSRLVIRLSVLPSRETVVPLCQTQATHHNCVTLDEGIVVGHTYASGVLQMGAWWATRDRTLRSIAGILHTRCVPHSWWAKKSRKTISKGWPPFMAARHGNQSRTLPDRRLCSPWSYSQAGPTHSCYDQSGSRTWFETPVHEYTSR